MWEAGATCRDRPGPGQWPQKPLLPSGPQALHSLGPGHCQHPQPEPDKGLGLLEFSDSSQPWPWGREEQRGGLAVTALPAPLSLSLPFEFLGTAETPK